MEYRGHIHNGVVVLEGACRLSEGTEVRVQPLKKKKTSAGRRKRRRTLGQAMLRFAGVVKGLPSDLARNHDHYLHGRPRK